jgi:hypothetical protein
MEKLRRIFSFVQEEWRGKEKNIMELKRKKSIRKHE